MTKSNYYAKQLECNIDVYDAVVLQSETESIVLITNTS